MEVSLTQIMMQGFATGIGAGFATIFSFIVLRYFPKFWEAFERIVKSGLKDNPRTNTTKKTEEANVLDSRTT